MAVVSLACATPADLPSDSRREPEPPALTTVREDPTDSPIPGVDGAVLAEFEAGDALFNHAFRDAQGLGPLYVHRSCGSCHEEDTRGPGAVRRIAAGAGELLFGDVVRPRMAGGASTPLLAPEREGVRETVRLGPPTFGRGFMEAVADATLLEYARTQAARDDGIHGRVHRVPVAEGRTEDGRPPRLGRFGHKARSASLEEFIADAFHSDMGLTTPLRPTEPPNPDGLEDDARPGVDVDAEALGQVTLYVRLLAIPRRPEPDPEALALFDAARCAVCHVPRVRTRSDHPDPWLADAEVALYTDLLLHDMGEGLADGIIEHDAGPRLWRTAPLMGLRHLRAFLHDGRVETVRDAIAAHRSEGSEANDSVRRFDALPEADQDRLVRFVEEL